MRVHVPALVSGLLATVGIVTDPAKALAAEMPSTPVAVKPPTLAEVLAQSKGSDWRPLDPDNTLYMDLPTGRVIIELAPAFAPNNVTNIKALVHEGYFDGLSIVRAQDNYVTQWGDPEEDEAKAKRIKTAKKSVIGEFTVPMKREMPFARLPDWDGYASEVGFSNGFPSARDPKTGSTWLCHCYGMVGVARGNDANSGSGATLYTVIGNAPRHLDRNITVVGRVLQGMDLLSSVPRGADKMGYYEKPEQRMPIKSIRIVSDVPPADRTELEVLKTDTPTFQALIESQRNRREEWFKVPSGYVDLCNVPIPVRNK